MKYRFFTVSTQWPQAGEQELNAFLAAHRVAKVDKQFVSDGGNSHWAFAVAYDDGSADATWQRKGKVDYKEVLNEQDFTLYSRLRSLRKELAEKDRVPAYALFNNQQLAAMVQQRARGIDDLAAIDGIGKARVEKYGQVFVDALRQAETEAGDAPDPD